MLGDGQNVKELRHMASYSSLLSSRRSVESKLVHLAAPYIEFAKFWYFDVLKEVGLRIRCAKCTHLRLKHQPVGRPLLAHRTPLSECAVTATASSEFCCLSVLLRPPPVLSYPTGTPRVESSGSLPVWLLFRRQYTFRLLIPCCFCIQQLSSL